MAILKNNEESERRKYVTNENDNVYINIIYQY